MEPKEEQEKEQRKREWEEIMAQKRLLRAEERANKKRRTS
jgi:hypothetical protein